MRARNFFDQSMRSEQPEFAGHRCGLPFLFRRVGFGFKEEGSDIAIAESIDFKLTTVDGLKQCGILRRPGIKSPHRPTIPTQRLADFLGPLEQRNFTRRRRKSREISQVGRPRHFGSAFKIDHSLSSRAKLSYYWHRTETASAYSAALSGADGLPEPITQAMGTYTTAFVQRLNFEFTLTPTMLFHAGIGFLDNKFFDDPVVTNFNPEKELGLKGFPTNRLFPYITGLCAAGSWVCSIGGAS